MDLEHLALRCLALKCLDGAVEHEEANPDMPEPYAALYGFADIGDLVDVGAP